MTTTETGIVEKVARAIAHARSGQTTRLRIGDWDDRDEDERQPFIEMARAAIAAMPDTQLPADVAGLPEFLTTNRRTHSNWAVWFEANPDKEAEYVATGEWDDAKEHRRLEAGYSKVIAALEAQFQLLQTMASALEPFAEACDDCVDDRCADQASIWEHSAAMLIEFRHLRDAAAALAQCRESRS